MKDQRALVTGGNGFLGSALSNILVKEGYKVKVLAREKSRNFQKKAGVEYIRADINDEKKLFEAVKGVDSVFHTAALAGVYGSEKDYYRTNVEGTKKVIKACLYEGARLIHTSSPSVIFNGKDMENADASTPYPDKYGAAYPKTKAEAEREVLKAVKDGLKSIILRPHLIWGPGDNHLIPRILARADRLARIGSKNPLIDTLYIDNAVWAHLLADKALKAKPDLSGKVYFVSDKDPVPLWDMVNAILKAGNKKEIKKQIPLKLAMISAWLMENSYKLLNIKKEPLLTVFTVQELSTAHWFNIDELCKDTGYSPLISRKEGLRKLKKHLSS